MLTGLATAKALAETRKWHIIMACRDFLKAERAAKSAGMSKQNYTILHLDLASLDSVREFVDGYKRSGRPLDVLVCNAAVYQPIAKEPSFTAEGFELSVGTNHLGHFLLSRLLLDDLKQSDYPSKRLIIVGSITGTSLPMHLKWSYYRRLWYWCTNLGLVSRKHEYLGRKRTSQGQPWESKGTCRGTKWA